MDYRRVPERDFDGICSLGMMEHVGVRHYDEYFSTCSPSCALVAGS